MASLDPRTPLVLERLDEGFGRRFVDALDENVDVLGRPCATRKDRDVPCDKDVSHVVAVEEFRTLDCQRVESVRLALDDERLASEFDPAHDSPLAAA